MKKLLLLALLLPLSLKAEQENIAITQTAAPNAMANWGINVIYGQDGTGRLRQLLVGTDGKLSVSSAPAAGVAQAVSVIAYSATGVAPTSNTVTAALLANYTTLSQTVRTINSGVTTINISSAAGVSGGGFWIEVSTLGPSGFYYSQQQNVTAPTVYSFSGVSLTPIVYEPLSDGECLVLSAATDTTATVKVTIKRKTPGTPQ